MKLKLPSFKSVKAMVIGDLILDRSWSGNTNRISPEAPIPIVDIQTQTECVGGAGNVAMNLAALHANVSLMGILGLDDAADCFKRSLTATINSDLIEQSAETSTIVKIRILSHQQQLIRLDLENPAHFSHINLTNLNTKLLTQLPHHNVLILSDYGKGTLQDPQLLIQAANQLQIPVLVDPKGMDFNKYRQAYCLTPNRHEFERIFGVCRNNHELEEKGLQALHQLKLQALLITRGAEGMTLIRANKNALHLPATSSEAKDVTGAGDTVISVLAAGLAAGQDIEQALQLANIAAGLAVTQVGTVTVNAQDIERAIAQEPIKQGVLTVDEALYEINNARLRQEKIVMANGCFDVIHSGHVGYFVDAKKLGDRLIVAVNDDASIRKIKGPSRPFQKLSERMKILQEFRSVDWVVSFSDDTPKALIEKLSPDVLVKGVDYEGQSIVGGDHVMQNGGEVHYVGPPKVNSSTAIIQKIAELEEVE